VVIVVAVAGANAAPHSIDPTTGNRYGGGGSVQRTQTVPEIGGSSTQSDGGVFDERGGAGAGTRSGASSGAGGQQADREGNAGSAIDDAAPAHGGMATTTDPVTGSEPAQLGLKILQDASVTLRVKRGRIDETFAAVAALARSMDGYVVSSTLADSSHPGAGMATISLRVPHGRFDSALDSLREHGRFTRLQITSQDVTQEYVDAHSRLRHDEAVEARLLKLLGRANTVSDALVIQDRLDAIQQSIEVEKGRINYLDKLTQLSTINLTIVEHGRGSGSTTVTGDGGHSWGIRRAVDDAAHRFVGNVNRAIVGLGAALPALLALVLLALGARRWARRRRTGAV
jgi:hypothetical protein